MRKRILCIVLACALLAGIVAVGFVTNEPGNTSDGDKGRQVSDYFYIQIYGADDQVVARYKVTLTGTLFAKSREEMIEKNGVSSGRYKNRLTKCTNNI